MNEKYIETGRKRQKQKTRNKILATAQDFLAHGKEFSLEEIAEHTGISRATVYRYYSNVEILAVEAVLDMNTKDPEYIYESLKGLNTEEMILGIQDYYNNFTLANEPVFRKYLSVVMADTSQKLKRGARRMKTLRLALERNNLDLSKSDQEKFAAIATVLMGMEPIIVTKDVCQLNNKESLEVLEWGLKMILKGILSGK